MRLFTSAAFFVSVICSWVVLDVLACKNDKEMFIVKRTKGPATRRGFSRFNPYSSSSKGESSNESQDLPNWLSMKVSKTVFSTNAMAMLTTGQYFHPETSVGYENPVVKAHKIKDEKDIFMIYTEVSNLKQVKQYIDGGILTHKGERIALLLLVYQGHALTKENEEEYRPLMKESRDMYLREYHMLHLDPFYENYAYMPGQRLLNLLDWGHARYEKVPAPSSYELEVLHPDANLPPPPSPKPDNIPPVSHDYVSSRIELFIRDPKRIVHRLWWNDEVNYYKLSHPDEAPTALKVSWVKGIREKQAFIMEVSYAMKVHEYRFAATLKVGETTWISYLVVELPGKMKEDLPETPQVQEKLQRLQKAAISRYKTKYDMINLRPKFTYDLAAKKAYIYDWSSARHKDLPDGTLQSFGELTPDLIKQAEPDTCIPKLLAVMFKSK